MNIIYIEIIFPLFILALVRVTTENHLLEKPVSLALV